MRSKIIINWKNWQRSPRASQNRTPWLRCAGMRRFNSCVSLYWVSCDLLGFLSGKSQMNRMTCWEAWWVRATKRVWPVSCPHRCLISRAWISRNMCIIFNYTTKSTFYSGTCYDIINWLKWDTIWQNVRKMIGLNIIMKSKHPLHAHIVMKNPAKHIAKEKSVNKKSGLRCVETKSKSIIGNGSSLFGFQHSPRPRVEK